MSHREHTLSPVEAERVRGLLRDLRKAESSQAALALKLAISQQHLSNVLSERVGVGYSLARKAATLAKVPNFENWLRGRPGVTAPKLKDRPGFLESIPEARVMFKSVPEYAYGAIGELMGENLPEHVTPLALGLLASGWHEMAKDEERSAAITTKAEREMAEEDGLFATPSKK